MHARCASVISQKPVWGFNVIFIPLWPIGSGHYKYYGHAHATTSTPSALTSNSMYDFEDIAQQHLQTQTIKTVQFKE
jgi:hypothetical protein